MRIAHHLGRFKPSTMGIAFGEHLVRWQKELLTCRVECNINAHINYRSSREQLTILNLHLTNRTTNMYQIRSGQVYYSSHLP